MAKGAPPGADLAARSLVLTTAPEVKVWRRLYPTRFSDPLGWSAGPSRFSDPTGGAFGVVYLGSSAKVAFVETLLRDRADGRGPDCIIEMTEIRDQTLASIQATEPLRLVDLTGDGALRTGVPSDVAGARDHTLSRQWAAAFHAHPDRPDGIFYPSRLNEERCAAIFDCAVSKLKPLATPALLDCRSELASILDELEIAIR